MEAVLAMGVFVAAHVAVARTAIKPSLISRVGERGYLAVYSALSLLLLAWVIVAVLRADRTVLWAPPGGAYAFAAVASLIGFVLLGAGAASPNPLSVTFRKTGFDAARPGVIGWVRHPIIWGLSLWGLAHTPANGEWPTLVLFAGSAAFGIVGVRGVERRAKRRLGDAEWARLAAGKGGIDRNAIAGAALGLTAWIGLLHLHPFLFGADPLRVLRGSLW